MKSDYVLYHILQFTVVCLRILLLYFYMSCSQRGHFCLLVSALGKRDCWIIQEGEKLDLDLRTKTLATQGEAGLLSILVNAKGLF